MRLSRRKADEADDAAVASVEEDEDAGLGKGRPTPKRRDSVAPRGPVSAPKNRKEAYARQKDLAKKQRTASRTPAAQLTTAQRRQLLRSGDPSVLPRRDQGPTRKLARDWVDSHRMLSNYLLILFPLIVVGYLIPGLQFGVLVIFLGLLVEWYIVGGKIRKLAIARNGSAQGNAMSIGFYAGSRAYIPRRWRLPAPRVQLHDKI